MAPRTARHRCDVLVVGAGPAGAVAALALARLGADVTLVDKAAFPRDKACGDLVGPRGVRLLEELGVPTPGARPVTGMRVVGPSGRSVLHPRHLGDTYADHGIVLPRERLDALLVDAAREAGARFRRASAKAPVGDGAIAGFALSDGSSVTADVIVGADGAHSHVGRVSGSTRPGAALWGFALRAYADGDLDLPTIVAWEPRPWRALPGYGWVFPGPHGRVNVGLGVGLRHDRAGAGVVAELRDRFVGHLRAAGLLAGPPHAGTWRGAWLRMGMVGATPGRGRVLLVGDAAGLVNPLQGEGIAEAMGSARLAAQAIAAHPGRAAAAYHRALTAAYGRFHGANAAVHAAMVGHPRALAAATRLLTAPAIGRLVAGGWAVYWNDLLDGAHPGASRMVAAVADRVVDLATRRSHLRRSLPHPSPR